MKTKFLLFFLFLETLTYAGTPVIEDTSIIYGIIIAILGSVLSISYLVRLIKNKLKEKRRINKENPDIN